MRLRSLIARSASGIVARDEPLPEPATRTTGTTAPAALNGKGEKRALYSKHGVTEYWLVDPMAEAVEIHRPQGDILIPSRTFGRNETLRSELFPGLEINLDEVFSS